MNKEDAKSRKAHSTNRILPQRGKVVSILPPSGVVVAKNSILSTFLLIFSIAIELLFSILLAKSFNAEGIWEINSKFLFIFGNASSWLVN